MATNAEAALALRRLLAVFGDPATTVQLAEAKAAPAAPADSMRMQWVAGNTLVLPANSYAGADDNSVSLCQYNHLIKNIIS